MAASFYNYSHMDHASRPQLQHGLRRRGPAWFTPAVLLACAPTPCALPAGRLPATAPTPLPSLSARRMLLLLLLGRCRAFSLGVTIRPPLQQRQDLQGRRHAGKRNTHEGGKAAPWTAPHAYAPAATAHFPYPAPPSGKPTPHTWAVSPIR